MLSFKTIDVIVFVFMLYYTGQLINWLYGTLRQLLYLEEPRFLVIINTIDKIGGYAMINKAHTSLASIIKLLTVHMCMNNFSLKLLFQFLYIYPNFCKTMTFNPSNLVIIFVPEFCKVLFRKSRTNFEFWIQEPDASFFNFFDIFFIFYDVPKSCRIIIIINKSTTILNNVRNVKFQKTRS